jgi:acyl-CoA dehydrogenase
MIFAERVAADPAREASARQVASGLNHVTSSILMIREAAQPGGADARRALYARFVLEHRLSAQDPPNPGDWEREAAEIRFSERKVALAEIAGLLS